MIAQPRPSGPGTNAPAVARSHFFPVALSRVRRRAVVLIRVSRRDAEEEHPQRRRGRRRLCLRSLRFLPSKILQAASPRARPLCALRFLCVSARNEIRQFPPRSGDPSRSGMVTQWLLRTVPALPGGLGPKLVPQQAGLLLGLVPRNRPPPRCRGRVMLRALPLGREPWVPRHGRSPERSVTAGIGGTPWPGVAQRG